MRNILSKSTSLLRSHHFYVLSPPFIVSFLAVVWAMFFQTTEVNAFAWLIIVLLVDVGHVWSSIFRTYFDKKFRKKYKLLFTVTPILCFLFGMLVYQFGFLMYWRVMAYLAVYHFIRQQYGFMRVYSAGKKDRFPSEKIADSITIYAVTLFPIIKWHLSKPKSFNWFIKGDFLYFENAELSLYLTLLYWIILLFYICKEIILPQFSWQKNAVILGSAISWYVGIILFDSDLIFTSINVISHGIPYIVFVFYKAQARNKHKKTLVNFWSKAFNSKWAILSFILAISAFAFFEEMLWDTFVWRDHAVLFGWFSRSITYSPDIWMVIIPLLSVPQLTHYILDGFIWKRGYEG